MCTRKKTRCAKFAHLVIFLASANHGNVIRDPFMIGHTFALRFAFADRSAPEPDFFEIIETVGLAAGVGQERITCACGGHGGHGAEPRGEVALQFRIE